MSTLKDAAAAAASERRMQAVVRSERNREESFEKIKQRFHDRYRGFGRLQGYEVEFPGREAFEHVPYPGYPAWGGGARVDHAYGWKIEVDGVDFLFSVSSTSESLYLIHTCPQCGAEGASTFSDLVDLGQLLKSGPKSYAHKCLERESREVAYAIASAARDAKVTPDRIVAEAFERHQDLIYRVTAR